MPAISELDTTQVNTIRSGGYAGQVRICVDPSPVVFQCTVAETLTSSVFLSFVWDNTLQGDYADVEPDMTVLITATDDPAELRNPLWRGRAPRVPTADTFYVNESSFNLLTGYVVTVLNTYEALQMDRSGALVDGYLSYQNLPPAVKNMQSFYYGEDATEYQFSFAPVGQAMAQGATIDSYHWTIPGATYDTGNADTQNITVTVPYGHVWAFLDVTDSNNVTMRFKFEILVCDRDDTDFMFEAHGDVQINSDTDTGWTATVSYFAGVEDLLNRTRVAIVVFDDYKSGDGVFPNVMFVGYLVQEDTNVTGDVDSSTLAETSFEIQSFTALIAQLPVPSLAIRNVTSPSAWEQINQPTTQRVIWHLISRYSTFGTLCAIDFITTDSTWFGGEMDLEATTLLESINKIADEINAKLVFYPAGDAVLEINANFLSDTDRDALPTLFASGALTPADLFNYSLPLPYYQTVGQVESGFATFYTDGSTPVKLSGVAPATARQEGTESPVILANLLPADLTQAEAIAAAKQRIGDLLEWLNPPVLIPFTAHDGWRFLTPSLAVWLNFDLPATDSTRGLAVESTARYLLLSVSLTWHSDGTFDVTGSARLETQGGLAQINVFIAPNEVNTDLPVLPGLPDYDAFVPDGTLNYLTTDVPTEDRQPYSRYGLVQFSPMPTEDAADAADNMPDPSCQVIRPALNFKSSETRNTSAVTVVSEPYAITVKGFAQLGDDGWQQTFNMVNGLNGWVFATDSSSNPMGVSTPGTGVESANNFVSPQYVRGFFLVYSVAIPSLTGISITLNLTKGSYASGIQPLWVVYFDGGLAYSILPGTVADGTNITLAWNPSASIASQVAIQIVTSQQGSAVYSGDALLKSITLSGTGANPFTGDPGGNIYGDAFYQWQEGGEAELYPPSRGLRINSTPVAVPPEYNENHEYVLLYTGTGNVIPFSFADDDYEDNQNKPLYIRVCGMGMGT